MPFIISSWKSHFATSDTFYSLEVSRQGHLWWLRTLLPMQETWVPSLVGELRSHRIKPTNHNQRAHILQLLRPHSQKKKKSKQLSTAHLQEESLTPPNFLCRKENQIICGHSVRPAQPVLQIQVIHVDLTCKIHSSPFRHTHFQSKLAMVIPIQFFKKLCRSPMNLIPSTSLFKSQIRKSLYNKPFSTLRVC